MRVGEALGLGVPLGEVEGLGVVDPLGLAEGEVVTGAADRDGEDDGRGDTVVEGVRVGSGLGAPT